MKSIVTKCRIRCQAARRQGRDYGLVRRRDLFLIGTLALLLALLLIWQFVLRQRDGQSVRVTVGGQELGIWPLSVDTEIPIAGAHGGTNLLIIRDGKVYMEEADCPDGLCIRQGEIRSAGQTIICLPHEVVAEVIGEKAADAPDEIVR